MKPMLPDMPGPRRCSKRAFTLVEVSLALGVAGFCLVTLYGLLPIGIASNRNSLNQTMAADIATAILTDLKSAPPLITGSTPHFSIPIPAAGSGNTTQTLYLAADGSATGTGVGSNAVTSGSEVSLYRATLAFAPPATGQRMATSVRIFITWPALADPSPSSWPQKYSGSYEADTTLNRN